MHSARNGHKRNFLFTKLMNFEDSKAYTGPDKRSNYNISRIMLASHHS